MPKKSAFLCLLGLMGIIFLAGCGPNIPGISSPIKVDNGTIQVKTVQVTDKLVAPDGSTGRARAGYEIVLVKLETTGSADNSGFYLVDANGQKYSCGGLYQGSSICQVPQGSKGLILWYSDAVQIPLGSFLGDAPAATSTNEMGLAPTSAPTQLEPTQFAVEYTATWVPPTQPSTNTSTPGIPSTNNAAVCPTEWTGYAATDTALMANIQANSTAVLTPMPTARTLVGTEWSETDSTGDSATLIFLKGGRLQMLSAKNSDLCATWIQKGDTILIAAGGRYVHWSGTIQGNSMSGTAFNINNFSWTWNATKK